MTSDGTDVAAEYGTHNTHKRHTKIEEERVARSPIQTRQIHSQEKNKSNSLASQYTLISARDK